MGFKLAEWNKWHFAPANNESQHHMSRLFTDYTCRTDLWAALGRGAGILIKPEASTFPSSNHVFLWRFHLLGAFSICQESDLRFAPLVFSRSGVWEPRSPMEPCTHTCSFKSERVGDLQRNKVHAFKECQHFQEKVQIINPDSQIFLTSSNTSG